MKTTKTYEDGLEWLRGLRRKIAADSGHDLAKQADVYRRAAAQHSDNVYRGEAAVVSPKRRL
ncbi:hypothetical protein LBMAG56_21300 [Verrucomicrobiota bacterium]|nr:hypothetical protein LBMAG56_21300 [Verrucomicrobiota bacterium]